MSLGLDQIIMKNNFLPELIIDFNTYPALAENIWQAQQGGHPSVLTYNGPKYLDLNRLTSTNRKHAMRVQVEGEVFNIPIFLSRDEYPFACTNEGGKGSWIGHIPRYENSAQGGLIAALIKKHNLITGARFKVQVINYPRNS